MTAREPIPADAHGGIRPDVGTLIIGSGFAGLCMAIRLQEAGDSDYLILERADSVGGTWRDNTYPGAACDIPSHLYSFSFEQNPAWSRKYPTQPELRAYLEGVATKYGLRERIRFGQDVQNAAWDEVSCCWRVTTAAGEFTARVLVSGAGLLAEPQLPDIPGVERFAGRTFHSAQWDHGYDLSGKRIAVIGSGASAVQFVPEIAPRAGHVKVFQRTPNWIIPRPDRAITRPEKFLLRHVKPLQWLYRWTIYWGHEARVLGIILFPVFLRAFQWLAKLHIRRQVKDPALRQAVTPGYRIGCKRVLISDDWYPALQRENVELVTSGIREIRDRAIVTADGREHAVDVLIFGTGFYATDNPMAAKIHGRGGRSLRDAWAGGEEGYKGTTVHGFPNLFLITGPNTGLGHSSMVFMIESGVEYILRCLQGMRAAGALAMEVRAEVQERYNRDLQQRLRGTVWESGCDSWYKHASGKVTTLWPGFTFSYRRACRDFRPADYHIEMAARAGAARGHATCAT